MKVGAGCLGFEFWVLPFSYFLNFIVKILSPFLRLGSRARQYVVEDTNRNADARARRGEDGAVRYPAGGARQGELF